MDTTPFFTGPELFVFVLFAGALVWLLIDIAIRDIHILRDMFRDSEKFAKADTPAADEVPENESENGPRIETQSGSAHEKAFASVLAAEFEVRQQHERIREAKRANARG